MNAFWLNGSERLLKDPQMFGSGFLMPSICRKGIFSLPGHRVLLNFGKGYTKLNIYSSGGPYTR